MCGIQFITSAFVKLAHCVDCNSNVSHFSYANDSTLSLYFSLIACPKMWVGCACPSPHYWSVTVLTNFCQRSNQWYRYLKFNFNIILLSTCLASVHHPFGTFPMPCFLKVMWDCGVHVGNKFVDFFLLKPVCSWHWFFSGDCEVQKHLFLVRPCYSWFFFRRF